MLAHTDDVPLVDLLSVTIPIFPKLRQDAITISFGVDTAVRVAYSTYAVLTAVLYVAWFGLPERLRG